MAADDIITGEAIPGDQQDRILLRATKGKGANAGGAGSGYDEVMFKASPEIEEGGNTLYISVDDIRAAASYLIYAGSPSRTFNINGKFYSRTAAEAEDNYKYKSLLQAWRMPQKNMSGSFESTPETITMYGYGRNFQGIPTAVQSLNITFPTDVDYVKSTSGAWMPIVMTVSLSLREVRSMQDLANFKYEDFKLGNLREWS